MNLDQKTDLDKLILVCYDAKKQGLDISFASYFEDDDGLECPEEDAAVKILELIWPTGMTDHPKVRQARDLYLRYAADRGYSAEDIGEPVTPREIEMMEHTLYFARSYNPAEEFVDWIRDETGLGKTQSVERASDVLGVTSAAVWHWLGGVRKPQASAVRLMRVIKSQGLELIL